MGSVGNLGGSEPYFNLQELLLPRGVAASDARREDGCVFWAAVEGTGRVTAEKRSLPSAYADAYPVRPEGTACWSRSRHVAKLPELHQPELKRRDGAVEARREHLRRQDATHSG